MQMTFWLFVFNDVIEKKDLIGHLYDKDSSWNNRNCLKLNKKKLKKQIIDKNPTPKKRLFYKLQWIKNNEHAFKRASRIDFETEKRQQILFSESLFLLVAPENAHAQWNVVEMTCIAGHCQSMGKPKKVSKFTHGVSYRKQLFADGRKTRFFALTAFEQRLYRSS